MRRLVSRWSILGLMVAATLAGIGHRLATLPPTPPSPPTMVSAAAFSLAQ